VKHRKKQASRGVRVARRARLKVRGARRRAKPKDEREIWPRSYGENSLEVL
jgi:hypothetical protein